MFFLTLCKIPDILLFWPNRKKLQKFYSWHWEKSEPTDCLDFVQDQILAVESMQNFLQFIFQDPLERVLVNDVRAFSHPTDCWNCC